MIFQYLRIGPTILGVGWCDGGRVREITSLARHYNSSHNGRFISVCGGRSTVESSVDV